MTSVDVAQAACSAGADAIGLMFYPPSPRHLDLDAAARIRTALPPFVDAVAVVVNPEPDYLWAIVDQVGVSQIQFHGEEPKEFCGSFGLPYIKVLRIADDVDIASMVALYADACGILLDTHVKGLYGGSGKVFDWKRAAAVREKPVILAGGLTANNVVDAIRVAQPYAVDVSSGVETDGVKDPEKIRVFCQQVQSYSG